MFDMNSFDAPEKEASKDNENWFESSFDTNASAVMTTPKVKPFEAFYRKVMKKQLAADMMHLMSGGAK